VPLAIDIVCLIAPSPIATSDAEGCSALYLVFLSECLFAPGHNIIISDI
jgi:hypothetical protein